MGRGLIYLAIILFGLFSMPTKSADDASVSANYKIISPASPQSALTKIEEESHFVYLIITGLVAAIGALVYALKSLWSREMRLLEKIDALNTEKLEIALESANAVRESIEIVKDVHSQILKLAESEMDKKIYDVDIKNLITNMSNNINTILNRLERIEEKCVDKD